MGQALPRLTMADYLAWEEGQLERHEMIGGETYAMVGARRVHNIVAGNVFASLKSQLRGSPCRAFVESAKVQVDAATVFYPDVFVTCDAADLRTELIFKAPTVVVEVLSPGTEAFDRGAKFGWYRRLASLREYLLVDPDRRTMELYRRGEDGGYTLYDLSGGPALTLASIGCTLTPDEVFDGLEAEPAAPAMPPVA